MAWGLPPGPLSLPPPPVNCCCSLSSLTLRSDNSPSLSRSVFLFVKLVHIHPFSSLIQDTSPIAHLGKPRTREDLFKAIQRSGDHS